MKKSKLNVVMVVAILSGALNVWADIPTGYFKGKFKTSSGDSNGKAHVFVQTADVGGVAVSYGLVIRGSDEKAALFRIEELDDGSQAWIRLSKTASGLIGTNINQEAAFSAQKVGDGLALIPTSQGRANGCNDEIEVNASSGFAWMPLPNGEVFEGGFGDDSRVVVNFTKGAGVLPGKFKLGGRILNGSFSLSEIIPSVAALRSQVLNSESADGHSLERGVTALVVMIRKHRMILSDFDQIRFIEISNGSGACLDETSMLDQ